MTIAFGIDPGTAKSGAALIDLSAPRPYLIEYAWMTNADVRQWLSEVEADVVGVEVPERAHGRSGDMTKAAIFSLGTSLTRLGQVAVDFARDAEARSISTYRIPMRVWRKPAPHGRGTAGNKAVKMWLTLLLDGLVRCNNHERDAMGVALHAGHLLRQERRTGT